VVGSVLTTLAAFGGGWFLAGTTLKPVTKMTQTAHTIGQSRDFSARVLYDGPEDEIGHLATTFNEMLSQLEDGYQQLAHTLQIQRDFVADVSHELRTPLTTIRGNLDLLQRDPPLPKKEQVDILADLTGESERLSRLVSDLLVLARADAGRTLTCEKTNVCFIINDAIKQVHTLDPNCDIFFGTDTTLYAYANEDALKQVLLIILDNAIKYAKCPVNLDIDQTEQNVVIRIKDSGPGMSEQQVERIFDRFYRGDASRSSPGFGLGLSIAQTLVQAQQGTIEVESEVGKGSTFIITLPKMRL
jgi:signal transduction histidine kinase